MAMLNNVFESASEGVFPFPQKNKRSGNILGVVDRYLKLHGVYPYLKKSFSHIYETKPQNSNWPKDL